LTSFLGSSSQKSIIYGSAWLDELEFLKSQNKESLPELIHLFVPHILDSDYIDLFSIEIKKYFKREILIIDETTDLSTIDLSDYTVIILALKGILCELYSYADYTYVAGGFRSTVHSLLEPFLSNTLVLCGPNIFKSTEYDIIIENHKERIKLITESNFSQSIKSFDDGDIMSLDDLKKYYTEKYHFYYNWVKC